MHTDPNFLFGRKPSIQFPIIAEGVRHEFLTFCQFEEGYQVRQDRQRPRWLWAEWELFVQPKPEERPEDRQS